MIILDFLPDVREESFLHALKNVKKLSPEFKHCVSEINGNEYQIKSQEGELIVSCKLYFDRELNAAIFSDFKGSEDKLRALEKLLTFYLTEDFGRKTIIASCSGLEFFYDGDNFFLFDGEKRLKIGTDYEKLMEVERYVIPQEIRNEDRIEKLKELVKMLKKEGVGN